MNTTATSNKSNYSLIIDILADLVKEAANSYDKESKQEDSSKE
ncbi:hypothetical protein [Niallia nealsonii]|nr:hypothetical protein [Niallia nealsonii]